MGGRNRGLGFRSFDQEACLLSNWLGQLLSPRSFALGLASGATSRVILAKASSLSRASRPLSVSQTLTPLFSVYPRSTARRSDRFSIQGVSARTERTERTERYSLSLLFLQRIIRLCSCLQIKWSLERQMAGCGCF